jgi:hypothetical protein
MVISMKSTTQELERLVASYIQKFNEFSETEFNTKPSPQKWSRKEVVGHLIDSAQNNLRRFIVGQYEESPPKIVYQQDFWVGANGYQTMKKEDVIQLWRLINERIIAVLENMPAENYNKQCETSTLHSIEWLADDYVKHMKHHINQIIAGSFDIVYQS